MIEYFKKYKIKQNSAFTLAEVLITLGIIGVVAALTIPTLINKADEAAGRTAAKKAYSTVSNAFKQMLADNSGSIWDNTSGNWNILQTNMYDILLPYFSYGKAGSWTNLHGTAWPNMPTKYYKSTDPWGKNANYNDSTIAGWTSYFLNDGSILMMTSSQSCGATGSAWVATGSNAVNPPNLCGAFFIDYNGAKTPNEQGKDTFGFGIYKINNSYQVLPFGIPGDGYSCVPGTSAMATGSYGCTYLMLNDQPMP